LHFDSDDHADVVRGLAEALDAMASVCTFHAGGILFRQGEAADGVLVIRQGRVRLSALAQDTDPIIPYKTAGPGYVLGLPALFSGQPYSLTAEAVEDCVCGFVAREPALELIRTRIDLCLQAADLMAREIRSLREWQAAHLGV
jgi:CRP-like cAMP-binding protein